MIWIWTRWHCWNCLLDTCHGIQHVLGPRLLQAVMISGSMPLFVFYGWHAEGPWWIDKDFVLDNMELLDFLVAYYHCWRFTVGSSVDFCIWPLFVVLGCYVVFDWKWTTKGIVSCILTCFVANKSTHVLFYILHSIFYFTPISLKCVRSFQDKFWNGTTSACDFHITTSLGCWTKCIHQCL